MAEISAFERILAKTLSNEGGYSDKKSDYGKETYKGISRRWHPKWTGWDIVDMVKQADGGLEALKKGDITEVAGNAYQAKLEQLVKQFYKEEFWEKIKGDTLASLDEDVAYEVFDMQVNSDDGVKVLQETINSFGGEIVVDNTMGPKTLAALRDVLVVKDKFGFLDRFQRYRALHYARLVREDPKQAVNIVGWVKRALRIG